MTVDELKRIQRDEDLGHVHMVSLEATNFVIAHTDDERATLHPLSECELHKWLVGQDGPPYRLGLYIVYPHEPDLYSESYRADPWDFEPYGDLGR